MPERIQRKRARGWRMPPGAVYVGRPTVWQNRYGLRGTACMVVVASLEEAVAAFRRMVEAEVAAVGGVPGYILPLRGKDLACWCPLTRPDGTPHPCHADVLLAMANGEGAADA